MDEPKRMRCPECLASSAYYPTGMDHGELTFKNGFLVFKTCWLCQGDGLVPEDVCVEHSLIKDFEFKDNFDLAVLKRNLRVRVAEAAVLRLQRMIQQAVDRLGKTVSGS